MIISSCLQTEQQTKYFLTLACTWTCEVTDGWEINISNLTNHCEHSEYTMEISSERETDTWWFFSGHSRDCNVINNVMNENLLTTRKANLVRDCFGFLCNRHKQNFYVQLRPSSARQDEPAEQWQLCKETSIPHTNISHSTHKHWWKSDKSLTLPGWWDLVYSSKMISGNG